MAQKQSSARISSKRRIRHSSRTFDAFNCILLVIFTLLIAVPVWNIVVASFSASGSTGNLAIVPDKFTLDNYKAVFTDSSMWNALLVSIGKTAIGVVAHTLFCALFAYPMSKAYLKGRKLYSTMGIITMFFSGGMIPTFLLIKSLGLLDSFWVYIIPALFSYYDVIILMNFFCQIPESLIESAKIDGASEWRIFNSIVLPLSMPGLATIGLFHGVAQWNDFMTTKLYINNVHLYPLQMKLYNIIMQSQAASENGNMAANVLDTTTRGVRLSTIIITIVPILILYPIVQRYFVEGTMLGAVKG